MEELVWKTVFKILERHNRLIKHALLCKDDKQILTISYVNIFNSKMKACIRYIYVNVWYNAAKLGKQKQYFNMSKSGY